VLNTLVDLAVLNGLIALTGTGRRGLLYAIFKAIAFVCAVLNSYVMNSAWTFQRSSGRKTSKEVAEYLLVSGCGAVVNVGSSWYVATFVLPWPGLAAYWPTVAALVGTAFSFASNFAGYKYFVFSPRR
jgi:putative flippase GtrA